MKRKRVEQLKTIFEAPAPTGKRAFFRSMEQRPLRMGRMLWIQCSYMPKWEWILAVFLFVTIILISRTGQQKFFGMVFAIMPFLAVAGVSKSIRSVTYEMNELEQAARFSLKSIVLARMVIVGAGNLVLAVLFAANMENGILGNMLYLLVPYLVTAYGSLILVRKIPGKEGISFCAGLGAVVAMMMLFASLDYRLVWIFQTQYLYIWLFAAFILLALIVRESNRTVGALEEVLG